MSASANGATAPPNGLPDEATLARLAHELFAALPGADAVPDDQPESLNGATAAGAAAAAPAAPPPVSGPVSPNATVLTSVPDSLADPGITMHEPPHRAAPAGQGTLAPPDWALLAPPGLSPPAAPGGMTLADPYAPLGGPAFYFLEGGPEAAALRSAAETGQAAGLPGTAAATVPPSFDVEAVRRDFPILTERIHGHRLVWLDNAATTQKPQAVIDRLEQYYRHENSNVHRGAHELASRATQAYEDARAAVAGFLGAPSADDIVFVRGATEAINLVAQSWGRQNVGPGDEIVISCLEHHANIVPWQLLAAERGAVLRVIPVDDAGQIILAEYRRLLTDRTRLVAVTHVSNALGTVVPVREVTDAAHQAGARVLIDGAQSVSHMPVDVRALDADFYLFSGHKIFGPTGIGALYGKPEVLESMPPWQGGGNMIRDVTFERTTYQPPPTRFEAGTASIGDAVALQTALEYVDRIGRASIASYEQWLLGYATQALSAVPGLRLVGTAPEKASVLSFVLDGHQPEEVASALNAEGIAVRAGHHCAQPIMRRYGLTSTVRAALALYNTAAEVDQLAAALYVLAGQRLR
ncbi:MAG: family 2A encapsulin nanocompartment cargo protein cysteine desulfurase [Streptosporangiaceae bacterium]